MHPFNCILKESNPLAQIQGSVHSKVKTRITFTTSVSVSARWTSSIMNHSACVGQSPNIPIIPARASGHTSQLYLCLLIICQSVRWCCAVRTFCYLITDHFLTFQAAFGRTEHRTQNHSQMSQFLHQSILFTKAASTGPSCRKCTSLSFSSSRGYFKWAEYK